MGKAGTGTPKRWWCGEGGEMSDAKMSQLSAFLRERGVEEEAIALLEEEKVSKEEIYVHLVG